MGYYLLTSGCCPNEILCHFFMQNNFPLDALWKLDTAVNLDAIYDAVELDR